MNNIWQKYKPETPLEMITALLSFIVIPAICIHISMVENIFIDNITGIEFLSRDLYFGYGIATAINFLFLFLMLLKKCRIKALRFKIGIPDASFLLIFGMSNTYNLKHIDFESNLHVFGCTTSCIIAVILFCDFLTFIPVDHFYYLHKCRNIMIYLLISYCFVFLFLGEISGILEIWFAVSMSIMLYYMYKSF